MPITDKLDELLKDNPNPKLIWVGFLFFQEYFMENYVDKDPIRYDLHTLMATVNEIKYRDIIVVNKMTIEIRNRFGLTDELLHQIQANISPMSFANFCALINDDNSATITDI